MYTIRYAPDEGVLHLTLTGLWTLEIAARFQTDLRAAATEARKAAGRLLILSDSRNFPVQTGEVAAAIAGKPAESSRTSRTAVVVGSMLNRLQANRSIGNASIRVFIDWDEARAWLLAP